MSDIENNDYTDKKESVDNKQETKSPDVKNEYKPVGEKSAKEKNTTKREKQEVKNIEEQFETPDAQELKTKLIQETGFQNILVSGESPNYEVRLTYEIQGENFSFYNRVSYNKVTKKYSVHDRLRADNVNSKNYTVVPQSPEISLDHLSTTILDYFKLSQFQATVLEKNTTKEPFYLEGDSVCINKNWSFDPKFQLPNVGVNYNKNNLINFLNSELSRRK